MAPESIANRSERGSDSAHGHSGGAPGSSIGLPSTPSPTKSHYSVAGSHASSWGGSTRGLLARIKPSTTTSSTGDLLSPTNLASLDEHNTQNANKKQVDEGWPLLAKLMDMHPEFEAFGRFRELHIKNLLYYQVELAYLQKELEKQEYDDWTYAKNAPDDREKFYTFANNMVHQSYRKDGEREQWNKVLRIRELLHGYDNALLEYSNVSDLPEPGTRNMSELVKWIGMPEKGGYSILGEGSEVWGDLFKLSKKPIPHFRELFTAVWTGLLSIVLFWRPRSPRTRNDLVAPRPEQKVDAIAGWIAYSLLPWLDHFGKRTRQVLSGMKRGVLERLSEKEEDDDDDDEGGGRGKSASATTGTSTVVGGKEKKKKKKREVTRTWTGLLPMTNGPKAAPVKEIGNPRLNNIILVPVTLINRGTSFIATIVACLVPTGAIAVLSTAEADSDLKKLVWIGGFTLLFSMGLTAFTSEVSRVQIFMAAAAFSAVLVVFIQG